MSHNRQQPSIGHSGIRWSNTTHNNTYTAPAPAPAPPQLQPIPVSMEANALFVHMAADWLRQDGVNVTRDVMAALHGLWRSGFVPQGMFLHARNIREAVIEQMRTDQESMRQWYGSIFPSAGQRNSVVMMPQFPLDENGAGTGTETETDAETASMAPLSIVRAGADGQLAFQSANNRTLSPTATQYFPSPTSSPVQSPNSRSVLPSAGQQSSTTTNPSPNSRSRAAMPDLVMQSPSSSQQQPRAAVVEPAPKKTKSKKGSGKKPK